jgi:hypothetical protein
VEYLFWLVAMWLAFLGSLFIAIVFTHQHMNAASLIQHRFTGTLFNALFVTILNRVVRFLLQKMNAEKNGLYSA